MHLWATISQWWGLSGLPVIWDILVDRHELHPDQSLIVHYSFKFHRLRKLSHTFGTSCKQSMTGHDRVASPSTLKVWSAPFAQDWLNKKSQSNSLILYCLWEKKPPTLASNVRLLLDSGWDDNCMGTITTFARRFDQNKQCSDSCDRVSLSLLLYHFDCYLRVGYKPFSPTQAQSCETSRDFTTIPRQLGVLRCCLISFCAPTLCMCKDKCSSGRIPSPWPLPFVSGDG